MLGGDGEVCPEGSQAHEASAALSAGRGVASAKARA